MQTGLAGEAGLVIGALEDDDDNDDDTSGICGWVLSFRDKPKLNSLAFKPEAETSTPLRALNGARVKTGGEKMQLMLMQQHFEQLLHLPEANASRHRHKIAFCGRSCCYSCFCNCTPLRGATTTTEFKTNKLIIDLCHTKEEFFQHFYVQCNQLKLKSPLLKMPLRS